jgi:hypothetical protein
VNYQSLGVSLLFSDDKGPLTNEFSPGLAPIPLSSDLLVASGRS